MMVDKIIEDGSLRAVDGGFTFGIRLPWYRSVPLSDVEVVSVSVDQMPVAPESIRFAVNGQSWGLGELRRLTKEFWFVTDTAELRASGSKLAPGSEHDVELVIAVYPPYIRGLQRLLRWTKRLTVR